MAVESPGVRIREEDREDIDARVIARSQDELLRAEVARAGRTTVRDRVKGLLDAGAFARDGYADTADPDEAADSADTAEADA